MKAQDLSRNARIGLVGGCILLLGLLFTPTTIGTGDGYFQAVNCGPRALVALDGPQTDDGRTAEGFWSGICTDHARGELEMATFVSVAVGVGVVLLVRHNARTQIVNDKARGPEPPSVPPSHLHWDGHRWLRWDGVAWVPDSDEGAF